MKKKLLTFTLFLATISSFAYEHPMIPTSTQAGDPPNLYNDYFAGAGACMLCHNAQVNAQGQSVAIVNDWRSTMMANSAKDPFWQAKVSHEVEVNPQLGDEIQTVCTRCHVPMGNVNALNNGATHYLLEEARQDSLAMDGVSCSVCHQIPASSLGQFSGSFSIGTDKVMYGPYTAPFANPMIEHTGYTPVYSNHIQESGMCATCHTLITNPVDLNGVPTGGEFVEQSPYQEWKNSIFPDMGTECFTCHVPEIEDVVVISTMPGWLSGRSPYGMHHLIGGNAFMLKIMKTWADTLGVTATDIQMDSTIARTYRNLQLNTIDLNVDQLERTDDTLFVEVSIVNKAGHKLPTSYPSRRVFIELMAVGETGDTIFHSGAIDESYNLIHEALPFEPHHQYINQEDQVQIYEMVMGDVNNDVTTVLERAAIHLKDNRIPPSGFTTEHSSYDTTKIVGLAASDPDFNRSGTLQGTGGDLTHFHIPVYGINQNLVVTARIYYQTVSNRWLEEMFEHSTFEINRFKDIYEQSDKSPVLLSEYMFTSIFTTVKPNPQLAPQVWPNPGDGILNIQSPVTIQEVRFYNLSGNCIHAIEPRIKVNGFWTMDTGLGSGIYLVDINTSNGHYWEKIIVR